MLLVLLVILVTCSCEMMPDLPAPGIVMKVLSLTFARKLGDCRKELTVDDNLLQDFLRFWKMNEDITKRDMGCMVMCVVKKLQLVDNNYKFISTHLEAFLRASGADDEMTPKVMEWANNCRNMAKSTDTCSIGLEFSNCFKAGIEGMGWTPP